MQPDLAFFIPSFRGGGAETAVIRLANWFGSHGLKVDLIILAAEGPLSPDVDASVHVVNFHVGRAARALFPLRKYLAENQPQVFVSNMAHLNVLSVLARSWMSCNTRLFLIEHSDVQAWRAYEGSLKEGCILRFMRWTYPRADIVAAVSRGSAESLASVLKQPKSFVETMPNSVDVTALRSAAAEQPSHAWLRNGREAPVFVAMGRLVPVKGFLDLLDAFALFRGKWPARLILIGEGPQRGELERRISVLGLDDCVDLPGFVKNPLPFVARADAFLLSSHTEGQGIVLLEAMAVGTPIVATDCPSGPRELLDGGKAGLLVPVDDPAAMAEAMHIVLHDAALRAGLREAGLRQVQRYDIKQVAVRFMDLSRRAGFTIRVDDNA